MNMLFLKLRVLIVVIMETYLTKGQPLMTLPISYLDIDSLARWRHASKENIRTTHAFTKSDWKMYLAKHVAISQCSLCRSTHKLKKMFFCQTCSKTVCGNHVCGCAYCNNLVCAECAQRQDCRACWQSCGSC